MLKIAKLLFITYLLCCFSCSDLPTSSSSINLIDENVPASLSKSFQSSNFYDECNNFNSKLWYKANWELGKGTVDSDQIDSKGSIYSLKLDSKNWKGAEIWSKEFYSNGVAFASFKCPNVEGSLSSIFFYEGCPENTSCSCNEIDIEIFKPKPHDWVIQFVVYRKGFEIWKLDFTPAFDPSANYHEYKIKYTENGISFFIDNKYVDTCYDYRRPTNTKMRIHLNCWWPDWLDASWKTRYWYISGKMQIDYIGFQNI